MLDRIFDLNKINTIINGFNTKTKEKYFDYLINEFGILFTYHSNRIELVNNTLTLNDTREIINNTYKKNSITNKKKLREINETINHQNAFKYIFSILDKDLDIVDIIKKLHTIIGNNTIENAGNYKNHNNYLLNSSGKEIDFAKKEDIPKIMDELREKYNNEWKELTVFERAVNLHMAVINIHPFNDGNGRVARLIMNYELIKNNYPPVLINEAQKLSYYAVIEEININTDYLNKPLSFGDITRQYNNYQYLLSKICKNILIENNKIVGTSHYFIIL